MIGSVEMGVVRVGSVANYDSGKAIAQWERHIARDDDGSSANGGEGDETVKDGARRLDDGLAPYMGNLAVEKGFRRRGAGRALVIEACRLAGEVWAAPCVWLHVEDGNEGAMELYRKLGFGCEVQDPEWCERVGRRRRLFLRSDGGGAGADDWSRAKVGRVRLSGLEYLRWCVYDLQRTGAEKAGG